MPVLLRARAASLLLLLLLVSASSRAAGSLERFTALVQSILASPHDACGGRAARGHLFLTLSNSYHIPLLVLQRSALELNHARPCVESQLVTVCLDAACTAQCAANAIPHCVHIDSYRDVAPSEGGQGDYWQTSVLHHRLLADALSIAGVRSVCLLDADIALFKNPTDYFNVTAFDLQHNTEGGDGCDGRVNGGLLCLRNSGPARAFIAQMVARNASWLAGAVDQDAMPDIAAAANASRCALPKARFAGHCKDSHDGRASFRGVVSYHTNCAVAFKDKAGLLTRAIDEMRTLLQKNRDKTFAKTRL